jgi:hypothetical protein
MGRKREQDRERKVGRKKRKEQNGTRGKETGKKGGERKRGNESVREKERELHFPPRSPSPTIKTLKFSGPTPPPMKETTKKELATLLLSTVGHRQVWGYIGALHVFSVFIIKSHTYLS